MKQKIKKIINKKNKSKIVCLTAYSKSFAKILDKFCHIVLVGDSVANVLYGLDSTHKISLKNSFCLPNDFTTVCLCKN